MTSYNKVNSSYTATAYDLYTTILRDEWGFIGFVMSDWWTYPDGEKPNKSNLKKW